MKIEVDHLDGEDVIKLLEEHLADMHATSPPESIHALDVDSLKSPDITFWCARENGQALGCIALKQLTASQAEIKSMRTTENSRGRGVGSALLKRLLAEVADRGYESVSLETGSQDFFLPARKLYESFGFEYCGPFSDYKLDPNSLFMTLKTQPR